MQTEEFFSSEGGAAPAYGICNEEHLRTAVEILLAAFDTTTSSGIAVDEALRQADRLSDPVLSAGAREVIETLARTRMLQPVAVAPDPRWRR